MTFNSATNRFGKLTDSGNTELGITESVSNQFGDFWICWKQIREITELGKIGIKTGSLSDKLVYVFGKFEQIR